MVPPSILALLQQLTKISLPPVSDLSSAQPSDHDLSDPSAPPVATKACITSLPEELTLQICHHLLNDLRPWWYLYVLDDRYQKSEIIQQVQEPHLWLFALTCRRNRRIVSGFLGDTIAVSRFDPQRHIINLLEQIEDNQTIANGVKKMFFCLPTKLNLNPSEVPFLEPMEVKAEFPFLVKMANKLGLQLPDCVLWTPRAIKPPVKLPAPRITYYGCLAAVFLCQFHNLQHLALTSSGGYLEQIVQTCSPANEPPLPKLQSVALTSTRPEELRGDYTISQETITTSTLSGILCLGKQVSELCIRDFDISHIQRIPAVDHLKSVTLEKASLKRLDILTLFGQCEHMEQFVYLYNTIPYPAGVGARDIVAALRMSTKTLRTLCIHVNEPPWWITFHQRVPPLSIGEFENLRNLWINTSSTIGCMIPCHAHQHAPVTDQDIACTLISTLPTSLRKLHLKGRLQYHICDQYVGDEFMYLGVLLNGDLTQLAGDSVWETLPNLEELAVDAETCVSEEDRELLWKWEKSGLRILHKADAFPELW
ncbi:hypothetical protein CcaCcLH18_03179 [Colletotrichum camelliae]|nr:hypothetical protein CcaCcLH18_03179 [Colletotrichum camelliae]